MSDTASGTRAAPDRADGMSRTGRLPGHHGARQAVDGFGVAVMDMTSAGGRSPAAVARQRLTDRVHPVLHIVAGLVTACCTTDGSSRTQQARPRSRVGVCPRFRVGAVVRDLPQQRPASLRLLRQCQREDPPRDEPAAGPTARLSPLPVRGPRPGLPLPGRTVGPTHRWRARSNRVGFAVEEVGAHPGPPGRRPRFRLRPPLHVALPVDRLPHGLRHALEVLAVLPPGGERRPLHCSGPFHEVDQIVHGRHGVSPRPAPDAEPAERARRGHHLSGANTAHDRPRTTDGCVRRRRGARPAPRGSQAP